MRWSERSAGGWRRKAISGGLAASFALALAVPGAEADQAGCGEVLTRSITLSNDLLACAGLGVAR